MRNARGGGRGAGGGGAQDATALFDKYHPWVNIDAMMRGLCIGELVEDDAPAAAGEATPRPAGP